ncbi:MAG TPA: peroxide stress protein YaaA [Pseudonocardiaceae bacterium]|nr:peroxide stress protein YaaA [Pseudonocardiaceae bacterium]
MLVLLPPSETKAEGGDGAPLDLDLLSFPDLNPVRRKLTDALVELAADVPASITALGLSPRQDAEVARNAVLFGAPTMPALHRYTGVLYDALGFGAMTRPQQRKAGTRLAVASALFGVVRAADPIPAYRLSGGSALPGVGPLQAVWRPALEPLLGELDELVVDLRSTTYAHLARLPEAITVRVVSERGGQRTTVSHFNKATKGQLARALALAPREPTGMTAVLRIAKAAGVVAERTGETTFDLVTEL